MNDKPDITELAVAVWRLEKWLDNLDSDRKMAAKSALRSIKKYVSACQIRSVDPIGSKFDPGLAVEVINNEAENADENDLIIIETISPYIYKNGELIRYAKVIIGTNEKTKQIKKIQIDPDAGKADLPKKEPEIEPSPQNPDAVIPNVLSQRRSDNDAEDNFTIGEDEIERMMKYAKNL